MLYDGTVAYTVFNGKVLYHKHQDREFSFERVTFLILDFSMVKNCKMVIGRQNFTPTNVTLFEPITNLLETLIDNFRYHTLNYVNLCI